MVLYFEDSNGDRREIGRPKSEKEIFQLISDFLKKHNYKSHYTRIWENEKGEICYDVGSHSEFFVLADNDLVSRKEAIQTIENVPDGNWRSIRYSEEIKKLPPVKPLTEEDYNELCDRYGEEVEFVVRDMIDGKGERWK